MTRILLTMSRKQYTRRKHIPPTVKAVLKFANWFAAAFSLVTLLSFLGVMESIRYEFNPTLWNSLQFVLYTVNYIVFDLIAIGMLVLIHHRQFRNCSLAQLDVRKNSCLLGNHFLVDVDLDLTSVAETEQDINNYGKFKSVLIDVNRSQNKRKSRQVLSTFDTDNMQREYETEIDDSEYKVDETYEGFDLGKNSSRGLVASHREPPSPLL